MQQYNLKANFKKKNQYTVFLFHNTGIHKYKVIKLGNNA